MARYHVDPAGNTKPCSATVKSCPYLHGNSPQEAREVYEASMREELMPGSLSRRGPGFTGAYSSTSYYGVKAPREVQVEALNAVREALSEEEATQLVAACGTGKTYMSRQLLNHFMSEDGATGVGVVLTSSIKLAQDTASDLRPPGHDQAFGSYGEDYEVVEVHSAARPYTTATGEVKPSVREQGVVSVERIRRQIEEAQAAGKKVVIVSTYDSVGKVVEAQAALGEGAQADLLLHDEAHNILGQQKPTTVAQDGNELTAYTGFHNSIPGSLQARRRLYATATPVVKELPEDKDNVASLREAVATAERMRAGDQYARVTVYSDDPLVGRVSGFISQAEAVNSGCLSKPAYQMREATLAGDLAAYRNPTVTPEGRVVEAEDNSLKHPLTPQTYGALSTTIDALVAEADPGVNPPTNVLAYVGSIDQAEGYKEAFQEAALAKAAGMSLREAELLRDSPDEALRSRARARLLAKHAEVKAAHSRTNSEAVAERREAFAMFTGKAVEEGPWTPHKRVLANVDIFSEGVSISEIDTVVLSDDDKSNERSLTQAVGRALRVVPGNSYKRTGHVLVPAVRDSQGRPLNEASVELAAYAATRVERGTVATKLRGGTVKPDESTTFTVHEVGGGRRRKLARDFARETVSSVTELAAGAEAATAHSHLLRTDPSYRHLSPQEQHQLVLTRVEEKLAKARGRRGPEAATEAEVLERVSSTLRGRSEREVKDLQRKGKVISSVLSVGDVASLPPELSSKLLKAGVLKPLGEREGLTVPEKREAVLRYEKELSYAVLTTPGAAMTENHRAMQEKLSLGVLPPRERASLMKEAMARAVGRGGETASTERLSATFRERVAHDDAFVAGVFEMATSKQEASLPILGSLARGSQLREDLRSLEEARHAREAATAEAGEAAYTVDEAAIRRTGELTSKTLQKLLKLDSWGEV